MSTIKPLDLTSRIVEYESGNLDNQDTLELFADLANSGLVNKLQGHYGRTFAALAQGGVVIQDSTGQWVVNPHFDTY